MSPTELQNSLTRLAPRTRAELERLDAERLRLLSLLALIDEFGGEEKAPPSALALVRERPGIRASMIALSLGCSPQRVVSELVEQECRGLVRRDGLGWRAV
jgi:hypothetical protein